MPTKVLVAFYSSYGHIHRMAQAVVEGVQRVRDVEVRMRRIPELEEARRAMSTQEWYVKAQEAMADIPEATQDDLRWADGIVWGIPTRFGNMPAQVKQSVVARIPLQRFGALDELAGVVCFLLSPAAAYITGAVLRVDGGFGLTMR